MSCTKLKLYFELRKKGELEVREDDYNGLHVSL